MQTNLFDRFEANVKKHPHKPALIYFDQKNWQTLTYQQLFDSSARFISGLQACSLTPNMRAALMTPPSADFFALAFALLKLGIIPIIVDPAIGLKKVGACLQESQPDIFFGNALTHTLRILFGWGKDSIKHNLTIKSVKSIALSLSKGRKSKVNSLIPNPQFLTPSSSTAIVYTSGSTGLPKGAIYSQANFSAQLDLLQKTFELTTDEIDLPAFPLYTIIDCLLGVTSVIPDINFPVPGKTNPQKVFEAIEKFQVTNMFASPVVLDILEKSSSKQNYSLHSLKRIITAGAPAAIQLQKRFRNILPEHVHLFGIYGATEALPIAKIESREVFSLQAEIESGAGICLGKPVDDLKIRIIQITDEPIAEWQETLQVQTNVVGEITVQGPVVTRGYIAREDANRSSKIKIGADLIHRMGDVGYFDEHGRLWYCGRKSQRVITTTETLFTEQIENIFNAHSAVYRTALVEVDQEPVLWVELKQGVTKQAKIRQELIELGKIHSQASKIKSFLFMKKFPTDVRHNSKIIREELKRLAKRG